MTENHDLTERQPYSGFLALCKSPHTRSNYLQDLRVLHQYIVDAGVQDPTRVKPADLTRFAGILAKPGRTPTGKPRDAYSTRSMKRILASTRSFYRYLASTQLISSDPTAVFHYLSVRSPQRNPRPLLPMARFDLLRALKTDTLDDLRSSLATRLGFECGLRVSEIAGLKRDDIDLASLTLTVLGKGDKERAVPITQALKDLLKAFYDRSASQEDWNASRYLFPSPRDPGKPIHPHFVETWVKKAAHWANLKDADSMTVHVLRHTFGTCLAESGASVYEIRDLMGHSSIVVSENYVRLASDQARTTHRKAFQKYALKLGPDDFAPEVLRRWRRRMSRS